jgi:hypothetical protein
MADESRRRFLRSLGIAMVGGALAPVAFKIDDAEAGGKSKGKGKGKGGKPKGKPPHGKAKGHKKGKPPHGKAKGHKKGKKY